MIETTQGPARAVLAAHDPQTFRERLDQDELLRLSGLDPASLARLSDKDRQTLGTGTVIIDDRRRRPLYFDGRFLAARDLTREQNYFLVRQADLGRAGGAGVVHGLLVTPGQAASAIHIEAGHGATPSGELVMIGQDLELDLSDVPDIQRLDAAFGLAEIPNQPARSRTGLFVVALRPVEFTANVIAAYPTSISGKRTAEFGDIVEAAAITLIPYQDQGSANELTQRRARAARDIFLMGGTRGLPAEALPLAMIALERGVVRWVDSYMVRREVGAQYGDMLGLNSALRATQEAYLLQYDQQLQDALRQRDSSGMGWHFAAAEAFMALPPAGRMPADAINRQDFTQVYFPSQVRVDLSIVPDDEIRALIDESLQLPPLDLTLSGDALSSTSILVLVPVPRFKLRSLLATLQSLTRAAPPAAPSLLAQGRPLDVLRSLVLQPRLPAAPAETQDPIDDAWRQAIGNANLLWYVRRRNVSYRADITGVPAPVRGIEGDLERTINERLATPALRDRYRAVRANATPAAVPVVASLLASDKVSSSPVLIEAALSQLENAGQIDTKAALKVAETFTDPAFGRGIARLERVTSSLQDGDTIKMLVDSGALHTLDKLSGSVADDAKLKDITDKVVAVATSNDPAKSSKLAAADSVASALTKSAVSSSPVLSQVALARLENVDKLDEATADNVASTFADPQLGSGIQRLESAQPGVTDSEVVSALVDAGAITQLDRLGATVASNEALKSVASEVVNLAKSSDPQKAGKIKNLVAARLKASPR